MRIRDVAKVFGLMFVTSMLVEPIAAEDWGDKMFDRRQIKFGHVARMADTKFRVVVKNPYQEEIRITSLTTSCGCISWADQVPISIPSNGVRELTIRLDTIRHSGEKRVKAFVTLNEPTKLFTSVVTIAIEGHIRNDVEVQPSSVAFGAVDVGRGASQQVTLAYNGHPGWKLQSASIGNTHLTTQIFEQSRVGGAVHYIVKVELKPDVPIGILRDRLILTTNEPGNTEVSIPISGTIESDIVVADTHFGTVNPDHAKTVTVILRGKNAFEIERVEQGTRDLPRKSATSNSVETAGGDETESRSADKSDAFKIEFAAGRMQIHMLTLTLNPQKEPGMFDVCFTVKIKGRIQPVTFHASGRILDQSLSSVAR